MKTKLFGFKTIITLLLALLAVAIVYLAKEPNHKIETIHKEIEIQKKH